MECGRRGRRLNGSRTPARVISIGLTRPFSGMWDEFVALGPAIIENDDLERRAEELCRAVVARLMPALKGYRDEYLVEDYTVFAVHELDRPLTAEAFLAERGEDIASLLRGERQPLSAQEKAGILGHRISYLANDGRAAWPEKVRPPVQAAPHRAPLAVTL